MCAYARKYESRDAGLGERRTTGAHICTRAEGSVRSCWVVSCRVVSCSALLCCLLCGTFNNFPSSPARGCSLSLTLESHLGPDNSIITALGWPGRAFPLSADQVAAWTWVTAARLVRTLLSRL